MLGTFAQTSPGFVLWSCLVRGMLVLGVCVLPLPVAARAWAAASLHAGENASGRPHLEAAGVAAARAGDGGGARFVVGLPRVPQVSAR